MNRLSTRSVFFALLVFAAVPVAACSKKKSAPSTDEPQSEVQQTTAASPAAQVEKPKSSDDPCDNLLLTKLAAPAANTSCSPTERLLFKKDPTGGCLECLMNGGCLDDQFGNSGLECEPPTTGANPADFAKGSAEEKQCLATLACEFGVDPPASPAPAKAGVMHALCADVPSLKCASEGPQGACKPQILGGFPAAFSPQDVVMKVSTKQFPAGRAGLIAVCASVNGCRSCVN